MRILLTNDDGIRAPGIVALWRALVDAEGKYGGPVGDVWTVAPLTVQSATSHGVTFHEPLMVSDVTPVEGMSGVAVDGRPADCTKLAVTSLWPDRFGTGSTPDLVISGMNIGANVGINVIYSGTVAAALEAAFLGVPAIAVSLHIGRGRTLFDVAAGHARSAIERCLEAGFGSSGGDGAGTGGCLNINVPRTETYEGLDESGHGGAHPGILAPEWVKPLDRDAREAPPIAVCPMNVHAVRDAYEARVSPAGDRYFWPSGSGLDFHGSDEGSDVSRLFAGETTVTPLAFDLTDRDVLEGWRERLV